MPTWFSLSSSIAWSFLVSCWIIIVHLCLTLELPIPMLRRAAPRATTHQAAFTSKIIWMNRAATRRVHPIHVVRGSCSQSDQTGKNFLRMRQRQVFLRTTLENRQNFSCLAAYSLQPKHPCFVWRKMLRKCWHILGHAGLEMIAPKCRPKGLSGRRCRQVARKIAPPSWAHAGSCS